jgi:hypothetical protein
MLNGLFFCCNNSDYFDKKDVNISNSQFETSTPKGSIEVFLKEELKNKLGLIILYSKKEDLYIIQEIKKDIKIRNILNVSYKEIYKYINSEFKKKLFDYLKLHNKCTNIKCLIMVINIKNINSSISIDFIKDEKITIDNLKRLIINNDPNKKEFKILTENKNITNNNIIKVIFKFPDGKNKIEKKFLKTEKIQSLYDFINTINLNIKYDLISIFPYKQFKDYNKTLEEEELYPSCVIQIRSLENVEKKD